MANAAIGYAIETAADESWIFNRHRQPFALNDLARTVHSGLTTVLGIRQYHSPGSPTRVSRFTEVPAIIFNSPSLPERKYVELENECMKYDNAVTFSASMKGEKAQNTHEHIQGSFFCCCLERFNFIHCDLTSDQHTTS
jgi:hypothetical protein